MATVDVTSSRGRQRAPPVPPPHRGGDDPAVFGTIWDRLAAVAVLEEPHDDAGSVKSESAVASQRSPGSRLTDRTGRSRLIKSKGAPTTVAACGRPYFAA